MRQVTRHAKANANVRLVHRGGLLLLASLWACVTLACTVDHRGLSVIDKTTGSAADGNPNADAAIGSGDLSGQDATALAERTASLDADSTNDVATRGGSGGSNQREGDGGVTGSGGAAGLDAGVGEPTGGSGSGGGSGSVPGSGGAAGAPAISAGTGGMAGDGGGVGTGTPGGGATGSGGAAPAPCSSCDVGVKYTCRDPQLREAISFRLRLVSKSSEPIPLSSVTVRYWFTVSSLSTLALACDYAAIQFPRGTCADVLGTSTIKAVSPSRHGANAYLEVGFGRGAGTLDAHRDNVNDQIFLRLHDVVNVTLDQSDDYSHDCARPDQEIDSPLVTAYVAGMLVYGREPQ